MSDEVKYLVPICIYDYKKTKTFGEFDGLACLILAKENEKLSFIKINENINETLEKYFSGKKKIIDILKLNNNEFHIYNILDTNNDSLEIIPIEEIQIKTDIVSKNVRQNMYKILPYYNNLI